MHRSPWLFAFAVLVLVVSIVRSARIAIHTSPRDPVRSFSRADKAVLLARAGHRCERHEWLVGRCKQVARLEADHIHPYSRGGSTHLSNGQILCKKHNQSKSAAIPFDRTLRRITARREGYYPDGTNTPIIRRLPKEARLTPR